jgi:hypothetical protein
MLGGLKQTKILLLNQQVKLAKQLREINKLMPRERTDHDYTIIKQQRKKESFVYCAQYYVNGKRLPTKFSLKTTDLEIAKKRAESLKDTFLNSYGRGETEALPFIICYLVIMRKVRYCWRNH